ncbi:MAG TPA: hypothetical protein V6D14_05935 [Coleofasciculaceae cyanobacterium]|jgi:hypothetical protein
MQPIRQGDVILVPVRETGNEAALEGLGQKLPHLTLAEGEVTRHKHCISQGQAELYQQNDTLHLRVLSQTATLTHEEHKEIQIPDGSWMVLIQREYEPPGWR